MSDEQYDDVTEHARLRVGAVLREKWTLDALIGVGGMAAVYAATHRNGKRAAVKMLHPALSIDVNVRGRFLREGHVANKVAHPGAVEVIDDDVAEDGAAYLVMDLLQGETLSDRSERAGGRLDPGEVLAMMDQLLDVLVAAHGKGILHRDVKPENVFVTREGKVKVLDFGIARVRELSTASTATRQGSTMGTPAFMAPEQARGLWNEVDERADLWAVGATAFTLLSGQLVHEARTPNEQLLFAMTAQAAPLASVCAGLPREVNDLVDRALAFDKNARWPSALAMQEAARFAYQSLRGSPIGMAPRMAVPDVSNFASGRTVQSSPQHLSLLGNAFPTPVASARTVQSSPQPQSKGATVTEAALVSGRTGVDRTVQRPKRNVLLVGGGVAGAAVLLAVAVVAYAQFGHRASVEATSAPASASAAPSTEVAIDAGLDAPASPAPDASPGALAVDQLPVATSKTSKPPPAATKPPSAAPPPPTSTGNKQPNMMDKRR